MNLRIWTAAMAVLTAGSVLAQGKGFSGEPFGLRFQAALNRFSRYPDVAGVGGASAAAEWGSSINPAALAWLPESGLSAQYFLIDFEEGTKIDVGSASYGFETGLGWLQPSVGYAGSNKATARNGLDFEYSVGFAELQWAIMTGPETAVGVNLNYADSDLEFLLGDTPAVESDTQSYGIRIGALYEPGHGHHKPIRTEEDLADRPFDFWRFGMAMEYQAMPSRTTEFDIFGAGTGDIKTKDTTHQFTVRPGVAYVYAQSSRIYVDYQYGYFTDDTGTLEVNRFYAGVDHEIVPAFGVRGGTPIDTHGNVSVTGGFLFLPASNVYIDAAYQYNMFPEVDEEFGTAQTFGIAISVTF